MARRMMLKDTGTGRWGWWSVTARPLRTPWRCLWIWLRASVRYVRRHTTVFPDYPTEYDFDPETLTMRDRRAERRWLRLARRSERFGKTAHAVLSMLEMQKHIG